MKFNLLLSLLPMLTLVLGADDWGYEGNKAPEYWGDLKPEYALCKSGKRQGPIDLNELSYFSTNKGYVPLWKNQQGVFNYLNSGHSLDVGLKESGVEFKLDCNSLNLVQFHGHTPAEHSVNGKIYDLEAHFVFTDKIKSIVQVFGVFFQTQKLEVGQGFFKDVTKNSTFAIDLQGSKIPFNQVNLEDLYTQVNGFKTGYVYRGSMTTPPCDEKVRYIISDKVLPISQQQLDVFKLAVHNNNARPIQPINQNHRTGNFYFPRCGHCKFNA